jgi:exodeoxyribonuclease-3
MERQSFLFPEPYVNVVKDEVALSEIRIVTWNLQSPSLERAKTQMGWLQKSGANVLILTEATVSEGSFYLISTLESLGFKIFYSQPKGDKYFTAICTKGFSANEINFSIDTLPSRIKIVALDTFAGRITLMGMYAPASWVKLSEEHVVRRKAFHDQVIELLEKQNDLANWIIGGDINIVDPNNLDSPIPGFEDHSLYKGFQKLDLIDSFRVLHPDDRGYSWYSANREGFRFDYFFVSRAIFPSVIECSYDHQVRFNKYSDHSAMWLKIRKGI